MTGPTTELDTRFSDPDATVTDWATTTRILEAAQLSWITTVRADGRPHVTPLVAVWLDDAVHFTTGAREQKAVNLAHNPGVVITTGSNTWDRGTDVVVEGTAARVTHPDTLQRLAVAWHTKWDGQWDYRVTADGFTHGAGDESLVYRVEPQKILAFGKGTFSHTRHRFTG
ncbi:pyridoxamine 5'-phosphate oxidase family protein [Ilumatobacter nonamiensis]|uniref:pyridoxamine 5'-phosphate oxidase family protein n=1 Tax=Ilumatobacter nonamiensis TaxID=467093 RepID=UPI00034C1ABA|nr:pyridoxamine 5'-phosphate oxidase family protein [Ilumatobacter nonamiensis]